MFVTKVYVNEFELQRLRKKFKNAQTIPIYKWELMDDTYQLKKGVTKPTIRFILEDTYKLKCTTSCVRP